MARMARVVVPHYPHHITQRGNRRQRVFFSDSDHGAYLELVRKACDATQTAVVAYCLMPNHVHFVLVPRHEDGVRAAVAEAHRRYTRRVNFRAGWRGHLWQDRFNSVVMDEAHLAAAIPYVELNPVRAGLCDNACDWVWSSVREQSTRDADTLVDHALLQRLLPGFDGCDRGGAEDLQDTLRQHTRTGRPLGDDQFVERLEVLSGRSLRPRAPGPQPSEKRKKL